MKAAVLHAFDRSADALRVEPLHPGEPAPDEVRLEMLFAPINPADLNIIEGTYGELPQLPAVLGNEGAGRVEKVGSAVTSLQVGDLVCPLDAGSWCSHRILPASRVIPLPPEIAPEQAALFSVNPPTAWALLHDFVSLKPGDWIVQNAANSAVGRCVIQLARRHGWRTLNVVRRAELSDELQELGATRVVTEETDLRREARELMDGGKARLALNAAGGASALNLANALAEGGTHVTYGAMGRQPLKIPNGLLIFKNLSFRGFWLREWFRRTADARQREIFRELARAGSDGGLNVPIAEVFSLDRISDALAAAAGERRDGKVLLDLRA